MVIEPKPLPTVLQSILPGAGETVLEGTGRWQPLTSALGLLSPWLMFALIGLGLADNPPPQGWAIVAGLSAATWAFMHARSGRYWERLRQLPEPLAEVAPEALDAVPTASKLSTPSR